MNDPITTHRVGVDINGQFIVNGKRIRFLGVNFAGNSPFMPTNNADAVAARLAKFGMNSVRFHHMDAPWAYNGGLISYTPSSSTNLHLENLDRLHFLVSRLKAHGIYANINLLVGRVYRAGDGLGPEITGMDWKETHSLGFFFPPALALQKDYALKLLTATNRFSGLTLAQDPAVAFVEIINENGILHQWLEGTLDQLPERYATVLGARWNRWLAERYQGSEEALLKAWQVVNQPLGTNMIGNPTFAQGFNGWNTEQHGRAGAVFRHIREFTNNGSCAHVRVTNTSTASWHVQLNQPGLQLSSTQLYTVSYQARAESPARIEAGVTRAHTDYANLGYRRTLLLTTNWQMFTDTFEPTESETNARFGFSGMGDKPSSFYFGDVCLQPGGQLGQLHHGASLASRAVPLIARSGQGFFGTRAARRDWIAFLRDLENAYYDEMTAFIRTRCGYPGLVFGTIMANSPATVQSRLDVIDAHGYWKHPQFPGRPWDSRDWLVENVSMVNTLDNTLAGIARQRIKGKPFTVTEYQHPSPIYYGAEGVLMLAAYGGLQDWDGLWFFDYGHGNPADGIPMGSVRGFFEIGQHPVKLPNMLLAANLFRRGDVAAAEREFNVGLSADQELALLLKASPWNLFGAGQLGMPSKRAFANRIATRLGPDSSLTLPPDIPGRDITSDTGELRWNLSEPGKGLLTYNTPTSKGLVGFADNKTVTLDNISLRPGATRLGWCTLGITLTQGESLTNNCTALIIATGWWENSGQVWQNEYRTSVGNQWGAAPVLAEVVPFSITLPSPPTRVRAWSLDESGRRKAPLPVSGNATSTTITVQTNEASLWFELQIGQHE